MKNNWITRKANSKQYGIIYFKDLLQIDETFGDNKEVDLRRKNSRKPLKILSFLFGISIMECGEDG